MKASEIIELLQQHIAEHGDTPIHVQADEGGNTWEADELMQVCSLHCVSHTYGDPRAGCPGPYVWVLF